MFCQEKRHEAVSTNLCDHVYVYLNILNLYLNINMKGLCTKLDRRLDKLLMSC